MSWPTPNWQTSWLEWSSQCWYLKSSTFRTGIKKTKMKRAPHSNSKCWRSTTGFRTKTQHPDGSPYPANAALVAMSLCQERWLVDGTNKSGFKRSSNLSATQNARSSTKNSPYIIWFVSRFWHTVDKFNTDLFDADGCLEWSHIRRIFTIIALQIRKEVCIISDLHQGCHILKAAKQAHLL